MYRLRKVWSSYRTAISVSALIFLALTASTAIATWQAAALQSANEAFKLKTKQLEKASQAAIKANRLAQREVYLADMRLAAIAWKENDFGALKRLLEKHIPAAEEDFRGPEWFYLQQLLQNDQDVPSAIHGSGAVRRVRVSHDRRYFVTVDQWGEVKLGDLVSRSFGPVQLNPPGRRNFVRFLAFGSKNDQYLVAHPGKGNRQVVLTNPMTRERIVRDFADRVNDVHFSQDGRFLAIATNDSVVSVWDWTKDGATTISCEDCDVIWSVQFSPTGSNFAYATDAGQVRVHNLADGTERVYSGHQFAVQQLRFSPNGELLASGCLDGRVNVWNLAGGEHQQLSKHLDGVRALASSPDGTKLVSTSRDSEVVVWDLEAGEKWHSARGHTVNGLEFAGTTLLGACNDGKVRFWEMDEFATTRDTFRLQPPPPNRWLGGARVWTANFVMSPDGQWIISNAKTNAVGRLHFHNLQTGEGRDVVLPVDEGIDRILMSAGAKLVTLSGKSIEQWDLESQRSVFEYTLPEGVEISTAETSSNDELLLVGQSDGTIVAIDLDTNTPVSKHKFHESAVRSVAVDSKNRLIASCDSDGHLILWELESGDVNARLKLSPVGLGADLEFSPDRSRPCLAVIGYGQGVALWRWEESKSLRSLAKFSFYVSTAKFSLDGRTLFTCGGDRSLRIWDVESGIERVALNRHQHAIEHLVTSADRSVLATVGRLGRVRTWRFPPAQ